MKIILNASNLGATGPRVVFQNLIPQLAGISPQDDFVFLLPSTEKNTRWELPANVHIQYLNRSGSHELRRLWQLYHRLPKLARTLKADRCVTLGDIGPLSLNIPHIIFLHNPYLVYFDRELAQLLPWSNRVKQQYLNWHFSQTLQTCQAVIVQTPVMAERVMRIYQVPQEKVKIVLNTIPEHVIKYKESKDLFPPISEHKAEIKLLFLASYYAHKNHRIILPLLQELKARGLAQKVHLFLTLNGNKNRAEQRLLRSLAPYRDQVTNLGHLSADLVAPSLRSATALFMPTIVETFGLPYLEAMSCGTPVLTSDKDFSRWICADQALYFDPFNVTSIIAAIEQLKRTDTDKPRTDNAEEQLRRFPQDWRTVAVEIMKIIHDSSRS